MKTIRGLLRTAFIIAFSNIYIIQYWLNLKTLSAVGLSLGGLAIYLFILLFPGGGKAPSKRLKIMVDGYELVAPYPVFIASEILLYTGICGVSIMHVPIAVALINLAIFLLASSIPLFCGFLRIIFTSAQLGIVWRCLLIFFWWAPLFNIILFWKACSLVHHEKMYEYAKHDRDEKRRESESCKTKYPILMVHGIFFRDWQYFNYWGRIPAALIRNGATIFYGEQQSAAAIEKSAEELKAQIFRILKDTGCEKVNIIAHSKGGLDSRYAISALGMEPYVASLTTINTPHRGNQLVDKALELLPKKFINACGKRYNAVFSHLGDVHPDFYSGVRCLTAENCRQFNDEVFDSPSVVYQSVMSRMKKIRSAPLPLGLSFALIRHIDGENDGLVSVESAKWGTFLGTVTAKGVEGISHGDMIDLQRKNILGFDVCEFFVTLVCDLKKMEL